MLVSECCEDAQDLEGMIAALKLKDAYSLEGKL